MLTFDPLASGSGGNLYAVHSPGADILIELGMPLRKAQKLLAYNLTNYSGCLVSHEHGDHAAGVQAALDRGLDCYMSLGTARAIGVEKHHRARIVTPSMPFTIGPLRIFPWAAVHDAAEPLGFVITDTRDHDRLLYATDTAIVPYRFDNVHVYAIEANYSRPLLERGAHHHAHVRRVLQFHMSFERALDLFEANDLSHAREIWLLHLSSDNSDAGGFIKEAQRATGVPVYVAPELAVTRVAP